MRTGESAADELLAGMAPALVDLLDGLTDRQRAVARMALLDGLRQSEVAGKLHVGDNTIELPAMATGTLDYSCAMGMYGGQISIVDRPVTPPSAAPSGI